MRREWSLWVRTPVCLILSASDCLICLGIIIQKGELYLRLESTSVLLILFTGLLAGIIFGREHDTGALKIRLLIEKKSQFYAHKLRLLYVHAALLSLWYAACSAFSYPRPDLSAAAFTCVSLFLSLHCYILLSMLITEFFHSSAAGAAFLMFLFFLENRLCLQWLPQNLFFCILEKTLYYAQPGVLPWIEMTKLAGYAVLLLLISRSAALSGQ